MEKKDLVIGKKYLHESETEVYYLGEGNYGDSVIQPTNGVDGITSLKDYHPKLKDIIGNDRFWAYENIHLELIEIEPNLNLNELIVGEVYVSEVYNHPEWRSLFKCISNANKDYSYKYRLYTSNDYHGDKLDLHEYCFTDENSHYKASKEESKWLNVCIKANKFIPKEDLDLYDDVTFELEGLKESTESNKNEFEVGTWYYCDSVFKWYFKHVSEDSSKVEFYDHINIGLKKFKRNDFLCYLIKKEIKNIRKVELSEIQEYLPDGHIDKTIKEPKVKNEGIVPIYVECIKPSLWENTIRENNGNLIFNTKEFKFEYYYGDWELAYSTKNFKPSTKEAFDAQNKPKSIEKWSVGSYVVFTETRREFNHSIIGNIDKIETNRGSYVILEKFKSLSINEQEAKCEWFATLSEAQEFSKTLLNKNNMFKKDDYIVITILNQNNDGFITNFCYKQRDNNYYLRPKLTTLGDADNGWGFISYNSSHWRYATKEEITEYDRLGKPFDITTLNKKEELEVDLLSEWENEVKKLNLNVYELEDYINDLETPDSIYNKLPGFLSEEKAHLLISKWENEGYIENNKENYTPKIGDWVVTDMMNADSYYKDKAYKVIEIDNDYPLQPCFKITESDISRSYSWCYPYGNKKSIRKALPNEIPNQKIIKEELLEKAKRRYPVGCMYKSTTSPSIYQLKSELEIDKYGNICDADRTCHVYLDNKWAEIIYENSDSENLLTENSISIEKCIKICDIFDEISNKLDLSLRDEKEINIKEIKSNNNNNNSKLNLSLNN